MANIFHIKRTDNEVIIGTTGTLIKMTGRSTLIGVCTSAAGLSFQRVSCLQTDATALTGTLRGAYIDVSNGSTAATGTIRGMELKARTEAPGDTGNDVAVLEGLSISADSKGHSVTTMRAAEFILDGKTGGTITEAVGLRIANNLQANKATTSYGLQIYRDSFDYTADIQLSDGSVINKGGKWGIGTSTPGAPLTIGTSTLLSVDTGLVVARILSSGTNNAHGIEDDTNFSRGGDAAYTAFDAKTQLTGTENFDHYTGFQEDGTISTTGTVSHQYSFLSLPNLNTGTITNRYGLNVYDVTGTGTLTNNYGIFIASLSKGASTNWAIYTVGTTQSKFGGTVTVGGEVRVGNTSDGIALRGIGGEGRILGYDIGSSAFNPIAIYTGATPSLFISTGGIITLGGNLVIPDGGTIGQAAGPLLEFDDANDFLEITGCKVGIGTAIPGARLHIVGATNEAILIDRVAGQPSIEAGSGDGYMVVESAGEQLRLNNYVSDDVVLVNGGGKVGIGLTSPKTKLTIEGTITLKEQASADADTAAYGQLWVKTATPNILMFTDDAGNDFTVDVTAV